MKRLGAISKTTSTTTITTTTTTAAGSTPVSARKAARGRRDAMRAALANAFVGGGLERAMEEARLGSYHEFQDGVEVWSDLIQVWDEWVSSIRTDALSVVPFISPRTKISDKLRHAISGSQDPLVLEQGGHRTAMEEWLSDAFIKLVGLAKVCFRMHWRVGSLQPSVGNDGEESGSEEGGFEMGIFGERPSKLGGSKVH
ncbi:hypothetical protein DFQ27_000546 [Actinomortierella ambigua]|uniref:Uncharacterized protein n=1 Tax=Actinomortierella ambigua TaxID=1343610 RepID=A0A9P6PMB4_9FUNG|nr:hypothetical protein DFQ27_000546 [Actinomortierella ambigua]